MSDVDELAAFVTARLAHYPARLFVEAEWLRKLIAEIIAIPHEYVEGDSWFSCSQARTEWDGDAEPGSGCSNEDRAGKPCDCGRDAKVARMLALIATRWDYSPEYKQEWKPEG